MTGLEYVGKGYKSKGNGFKSTIHLNYLEVPLDVVYDYPVLQVPYLQALVPG